MPFIAWIIEIFPEAQAPYTVKEITVRLQQLYSPRITRPQVYRALASLTDNPATAHIVKPLDDEERYHYFSAEAARRIARKATNSKPPDRLGFGEKEVEKHKSVTKRALKRTRS